MMSNKLCKNCDAELSGAFCNNCGQRESVNRVTFKETFQDFVEMVFSVNAPLMLTLKLLIVNPGKLFREYLKGKRKTYYRPVSFFILTTIVYVLLQSILHFDPIKDLVIEDGIDVQSTILIKKAGHYMLQNFNNVLFIFVFTCALFIKLFFKKQYSLAEYVAISFYLIGFYTLFMSVKMLIYSLLNVVKDQSFSFLMILIYLTFALVSFFKDKKIVTIIKIITALFLAFFLFATVSFSISFLIVSLQTK